MKRTTLAPSVRWAKGGSRRKEEDRKGELHSDIMLLMLM